MIHIMPSMYQRVSLIYNVMGQVVFDSSCSNNYPLADNNDTDTDNKDKCGTVVILLLLTLSSSIVLALYCCCQYLSTTNIRLLQ